MRKLSYVLLSSILSFAFISPASALPTNKIAKCTKEFEGDAEKFVTDFVMRYCQFDKKNKSTHHAILEDEWLFEHESSEDKFDKAEEIRDRMNKRHSAILRRYAAKSRHQQCQAIVDHLGDEEENTKRRQQKMDASEKNKDALIKEYSKKKTLTEKDKSYLLAEGVIYDENTGHFSKTKDKLIPLKNGFEPNPANPDAMEAFVMFMHKCRGAAAATIHKSVGTGPSDGSSDHSSGASKSKSHKKHSLDD